jgi:hypothetical protein
MCLRASMADRADWQRLYNVWKIRKRHCKILIVTIVFCAAIVLPRLVFPDPLPMPAVQSAAAHRLVQAAVALHHSPRSGVGR